MEKIIIYIGIKLRCQQEKVVEVKSLQEKYSVGDIVILELPDKIEDGEVIYQKDKSQNSQFNIKILKKADKYDLLKIDHLKNEEKKASDFFQKITKERNLTMKLLRTEISFDEKHLTFYFVSETRLDFRDLLKDLIRKFHKLIRLQQVGPRDEAKIVSGFGPCGRELCCQTFLKKLEAVSSDLAKSQRLSHVSSSKISGVCGKLMCCLAYEACEYKKNNEGK